ncbi:TIGR03620 family F420-dependent LLM class oxidoreductase [Nocardiopsis sediminis]|uniref:TIGR03620 family F420-dependent LLM class oxidoreductase n=1 Tax=Nocardiopsis sediminis TaxID=1778267 RepID=A0ABV8FHA1_9ACTN
MGDAGMAGRADTAALKRRLGSTGVWLGTSLASTTADENRRVAAEVERLGYTALWFGGDAAGTKEAFTQAALLLSATDRITVATGIASIWSRDAAAAASGADGLNDLSSGRFLLGLGVSHSPIVAARGQNYAKPYSAMRAYLDAMESVPYPAPLETPAPVVLAALRHRMLELARDRTAGAHPYFTTAEHTAKARGILGPEPVLAPEVAVVVDTDPERARTAARGFMATYLTLPNYTNNLRDLGWTDADFADGGSDALVDAIVPWGGPDAIAAAVRAHHEAGADHVCIQPVAPTAAEQLKALSALAPVLLH